MLLMKRSSWQRRKLRSSSSSSMRFWSQAFFSRVTYRLERWKLAEGLQTGNASPDRLEETEKVDNTRK
ncbi:hypothetical protein EYF80_036792 [Liparis tanakae]|uniref:Uncharacterized protein n=1 Tax=Liparis tanakae TaxID=230148 RepID=A0A4Z2GJC9_9TELE|nr:hypothetical protein EYF80_036792 [Liparis tanakae]